MHCAHLFFQTNAWVLWGRSGGGVARCGEQLQVGPRFHLGDDYDDDNDDYGDDNDDNDDNDAGDDVFQRLPPGCRGF